MQKVKLMPKIIKLIILSLLILLSIGCSNFYVKVIDQHGKPVSDVKVRVGTLTNLFLVSGSKTIFYETDEEGRFNLGGPRVNIGLIQKNGYEFRHEKGFGSTDIYGNYGADRLKQEDNSYSNPYKILAWKREKPEPLIGRESAKGISLISNEKHYEVYFSNQGVFQRNLVNFKNIEDANVTLLVRYNESNEIVLNRQNKKRHPWTLTLTVPNGGLINTNDIIRNKAPEKGYKQSWTIRADEKNNIDKQIIQRFYIKSKSGQVYGHFTATFRPWYKSLRFTPYWFNLNDSRNLTRPKKYIYCKPRKYVPENCSIDDFDP